jgi:hypothetical protein
MSGGQDQDTQYQDWYQQQQEWQNAGTGSSNSAPTYQYTGSNSSNVSPFDVGPDRSGGDGQRFGGPHDLARPRTPDEDLNALRSMAGKIIRGIDSLVDKGSRLTPDSIQKITKPFQSIYQDFAPEVKAIIPSALMLYSASEKVGNNIALVSGIAGMANTSAQLGYQALTDIRDGNFVVKLPQNIATAAGVSMDVLTAVHSNPNTSLAALITHGFAPQAGKRATEALSNIKAAYQNTADMMFREQRNTLPQQEDVNRARQTVAGIPDNTFASSANHSSGADPQTQSASVSRPGRAYRPESSGRQRSGAPR